MNTFERLTIEGFRRLFKAEIEMRPLTVMIGANGIGKTSFRLIRFLEPKEVLVCDAEDGLTSLNWADNIDLEHWLADYTFCNGDLIP
jgi:predicted ATPase